VIISGSDRPAKLAASAGADHAKWLGTAAVGLAVSTSALAVLATVVLAAELSRPAYIMPIWVVAVAAICAVLTVIGGATAARRRRITPWLAPVVTGALVVASLELFMITVPLALILLLLISVRAVRRGLGRMPADHRAGAPGLLLTIRLVPLFLLILLGRPVIECTPGGGTSVRSRFGPGSEMAAAAAAPSQVRVHLNRAFQLAR
jgi:hypothetical protein